MKKIIIDKNKIIDKNELYFSIKIFENEKLKKEHIVLFFSYLWYSIKFWKKIWKQEQPIMIVPWDIVKIFSKIKNYKKGAWDINTLGQEEWKKKQYICT